MLLQQFSKHIKGKIVLITGVSASGIGSTTATALASQHPKLLILTGRSAEKVQIVADGIRKQYPEVECRFLQVDLSSQASIRKAGVEVMTYKEDIDIVINNAGVMAIPDRTLSVHGFEIQFATNHLGHFLLTNLILPKLITASKTAEPGSVRIVNVSSSAHQRGGVRFHDINFTKPASDLPVDEQPDIELVKQMDKFRTHGGDSIYSDFVSYAQSKTANILFSIALNRKLAWYGIESFALYPGSIDSELQRHIDPDFLIQARKNAGVFKKSLAQGASTTLVAALDPALKADGRNIYLSDYQLTDAAPFATDGEKADQLWKLGEDILKEKFPIS